MMSMSPVGEYEDEREGVVRLLLGMGGSLTLLLMLLRPLW